jgi:flagellar protein FliO/FliZ
MSTVQGFTSLLWFLAIIVLIPVALWLLKRTPLGGGGGFGATAGPAGLRAVDTLSLSPSQRIVTIEVGHGDQRQWLVLGVTAQTITPLHSMAPQSDAAPAATPLPAFAQLLSRLRRDAAATPGAPLER